MEPKIATLTIKGFRVFRELKIEGLGRVNLITGRNNTGKSSLLEAFRILASNALASVIYDIVHSREEETAEMGKSGIPLSSEGVFSFSSLFLGFPSFPPSPKPIVITSNGDGSLPGLSLCMAWVREVDGGDGSRIWEAVDGNSLSGARVFPALAVEAKSKRRYLPLANFQIYSHGPFGPISVFDELSTDRGVPWEFVNPYGGERTSSLVRLWDRIVLSDLQRYVEDGLRIIDPNICGISMIESRELKQARTAIVRVTGLSYPIDLRSFGDGMNRLFGIILSLVNAKNGLLLIDEFENGLHHTVQTDIWRVIFKLARDLDIQVFATSHSWDAIEAFQKAASEAPDEGVLVRLTRKDENIIPTLFREEELAIATRNHIEVR